MSVVVTSWNTGFIIGPAIGGKLCLNEGATLLSDFPYFREGVVVKYPYPPPRFV